MNKQEIALLLKRVAGSIEAGLPLTHTLREEADLLVKPEPREWAVWIDPRGHLSSLGNHCGEGVATKIHVREVMP